MAYDARLATRITNPVDLRLRMLALLRGQSIGSVLDSVLDQALPAADELAARLANGPRDADEPAEVAA